MYTDSYIDLYVWERPLTEVTVAFQLCYDKVRNEHALTWLLGKGRSHRRVDTGDRGRLKPVLMPDGSCDIDLLLTEFDRRSGRLPHAVAKVIRRELQAMA
jgi:hypothetical protein